LLWSSKHEMRNFLEQALTLSCGKSEFQEGKVHEK
jgi:hypothetical protein